MSSSLQIRAYLVLATVALLARSAPASAQAPPADPRLQAVLERTIAAGALPADVDRDALTASLDALIAAAPEHELAVLAQRAAWRIRTSAANPVITVRPASPRLQVEADRLLLLARPWVLRADIDVSVDGAGWTRIDTLVTGAPGCGAFGAALPSGPGLHRVESRMTLSFFEPADERNLCWHGTPGGQPDPLVAAYASRSPRCLWREVRYSPFSYAVYVRPGSAGRLPDDYFQAIATTTAATVEDGLPAIAVEQWLSAVIGNKAAAPPRWRMDYCADESEADGSRSLCGQVLVALKAGDETRVVVRLQIGQVTAAGEWQIAAPRFRQAFITTGTDSIELRRLGELPAALAASADTWPFVDLRVSSGDITLAMPSPLPGQVSAPLRIGATVRNEGLRDAPRSVVRLVVACGDAAPSRTGRAGLVEPGADVRKETVTDIGANTSAKFEWEIASPPCATPWVLVQAEYLPRSDGWRAIAFERDLENNFAAVRIGTGERVRLP